MVIRLKSYFNNLPRIIKFIFTGGTTTAISFSVYVLFVLAGWHYVLAGLVSLVVGIFIGYFLNKNIVFSSKNNVLVRYIILWSSIFCINMSIIYLVTNFTAIGEIIAGFIALVLIVPFSYLLQKHIIFSEKG